MPTDVIMPALGMSQDTGKVIRWLRAEGEAVAKGEPLMEIETDKVTVEVEAPAEGTLVGLRAAEGDEVPVGHVVAYLLAPGESADALVEAEGTQEAEPASAPPPQTAPAGDGVSRPAERPRRRLASPKARRLARESGVDLDRVAGSGSHGAVVAADVGRAPDAPTPAASLVAGPVWQRMAERTAAAWRDVPQFFLVRDVDASGLQAWREAVRKRPGYEPVTFTDLLVALCGAALREHPRVNATWREGAVHAQEEVNVGVAVATDDGLVVPVLHGADRLELRAIVERRAALVEAARAGRLRPEDVTGGTFTVSNLGMYGVDAFLAIVNAPQAAILAVGRIADRLFPVDGAAVVRPATTLALSFDHRVVDGARGAQFLDTLAGLVEEPATLVR